MENHFLSIAGTSVDHFPVVFVRIGYYFTSAGNNNNASFDFLISLTRVSSRIPFRLKQSCYTGNNDWTK